MEEYRLLLERVDKLVDRRQAATSTYLTVNTAIVGAICLIILNTPDSLRDWQQQIAVLLLLVVGVVACDLWRRLILQYKTLIGWWFEQLREMEGALPESSKLLTREYEELYLQQQGHVRVGLTRHETGLTWLFVVLYLAFGIVTVARAFIV